MEIGPIIAVSFVVLFLLSVSIFDYYKADRRRLERIRSSWGMLPEQRYKKEEMESIASYFKNIREGSARQFAIDNITYRDLDLDDLFIRMNNTETTAGEETLYRLLREPSFDLNVLNDRRILIEFFQQNSEERESIQVILAKLGKRRLINVTDYFFQAASPSLWKTWIYRVMAFIALASWLVLFIHPGVGALAIIISIAANMFVYYSKRSEFESDLAALSYIVLLVKCAGRLLDADLKARELAELKLRLQVHYQATKNIVRRGFYLFWAARGSIADLIFEYIKIILLKELIDYEYLRRAILTHRSELMEIYDTIGLLDSLISISSFRESVPFYCEPDLKTHRPETAKHLEFEEIYHPLIPDPVLNSLTIDRSILVTGSNASGKSTFLKAVAISAILAQSFYTCLARKYTASLFSVFTSMAVRDSIVNGESYFVAEIKSIKRILDYADNGLPCLCLIDEVLRGTNTLERIASSSQVLWQLAGKNCICIAATHDVELTYLLEARYRNVHFEECITGDGIVFDYKLREGRATSRNAIKLLRLMGYSHTIAEEAEHRADHFLQEGSWKKIEGP